MKVKPATPGDVVRFPSDRSRVLRAEGENVPDGDIYWVRRLRDGSVVRVNDAPAASEHSPAPPAERVEDAPAASAPIPPLTTR